MKKNTDKEKRDKIRKDFLRMKKKGKPSYITFWDLADKYNLTEGTLRDIVYYSNSYEKDKLLEIKK